MQWVTNSIYECATNAEYELRHECITNLYFLATRTAKWKKSSTLHIDESRTLHIDESRTRPLPTLHIDESRTCPLDKQHQIEWVTNSTHECCTNSIYECVTNSIYECVTNASRTHSAWPSSKATSTAKRNTSRTLHENALRAHSFSPSCKATSTAG